MRLLVAGGGTGGHLFPGLALGEEVKTRHPAQRRALRRHRARGIEAREVPKAGYPLQLIDVGPLKRMGLRGLLRGLFRLPRAFWQSLRILRQFDPDVVIGVGGYSSGPVVLVAWLLRMPTAIQEQNALPGFTNRTLGRIVDAIFIAFPEAEASFPAGRRTCWATPSAARSWTTTCTPRRPASGSRIFVTGGSQGAHVPQPARRGGAGDAARPRSAAAPGAAPDRGEGPAGDRGALRGAARHRAGGEAVAFIDDMPRAYAGADLLVCRAGRHHHRRADGLQEAGDPGAVSLLPPTITRRSTRTAWSTPARRSHAGERLTAGKLADELRTLEGDRAGCRGWRGRAACWAAGGGAGDRRRLRLALPRQAGSGGAAPAAGTEVESTQGRLLIIVDQIEYIRRT